MHRHSIFAVILVGFAGSAVLADHVMQAPYGRKGRPGRWERKAATPAPKPTVSASARSVDLGDGMAWTLHKLDKDAAAMGERVTVMISASNQGAPQSVAVRAELLYTTPDGTRVSHSASRPLLIGGDVADLELRGYIPHGTGYVAESLEVVETGGAWAREAEAFGADAVSGELFLRVMRAMLAVSAGIAMRYQIEVGAETVLPTTSVRLLAPPPAPIFGRLAPTVR